ncbi:histidine kinase [Actinoplanes sp. NBRC 101535]|uniref:sensor histidine kinase n=1 Tax=Actinoplanes sp. NBRC 101535 TaxID=3032196 RepID=UPI00249FD918|nr:histidine kinase [Actinoplanes sp. NBRC 101535]GLX99985.1 two-component sensor histidine kinase [Actinoplanes sp. NBRC 101535]
MIAGLWRVVRYRAVDVAAILMSWFCTLVLVGQSEATGRIGPDEVLPAIVVGGVTAVAIWWRRSHPVAMVLVTMPAGLVTDAGGYAGAVLLYTLVTLRRGWIVAVTVLLGLVTSFGFSVRRPDPELAPLGELVIGGALLAVTVAVGVAVRSRRELVGSLRERVVRAEEAATLRADRLRSLERESLAREMHDALAHRISMVSLHAGALQIRPDLSPEKVAEAATTIRDSAHLALEDLREILGVLRAGPGDGLRPQPDLEHLPELIAEARTAGVRITATNHLDGAAVGPSLGRTVYRLVQEGLTNAGKHAPGEPVTVLLERVSEGDELHVLVTNPLPSPSTDPSRVPHARPPRGAGDGAAPVPTVGLPDVRRSGGSLVPGAGAGLVGLTERVALLGGRLRHGVRACPGSGVGSGAGNGGEGGLRFRLEAWLPWPS